MLSQATPRCPTSLLSLRYVRASRFPSTLYPFLQAFCCYCPCPFHLHAQHKRSGLFLVVQAVQPSGRTECHITTHPPREGRDHSSQSQVGPLSGSLLYTGQFVLWCSISAFDLTTQTPLSAFFPCHYCNTTKSCVLVFLVLRGLSSKKKVLSAVHYPAMFKAIQSCCLPVATLGLPGTHLIHQNQLSKFTPTATDPVVCTQPLTFSLVAKSHFLPPFSLHYNNNDDDLVCQLKHHQPLPSSFVFPFAFGSGFRTFFQNANPFLYLIPTRPLLGASVSDTDLDIRTLIESVGQSHSSCPTS